MHISPARRHIVLHLPLLLQLCITTCLALTGQQFANVFQLDQPFRTVRGGCARNGPNGWPMLNHAIEATSDAFEMAASVQQQIGLYNRDSADSRKLRALFFLFFGITFGDGFQISPGKEANYTYVRRTIPPLKLPLWQETVTLLIS